MLTNKATVGGFLSLIINRLYHIYDRLRCISNVKLSWQRHWQIMIKTSQIMSYLH